MIESYTILVIENEEKIVPKKKKKKKRVIVKRDRWEWTISAN